MDYNSQLLLHRIAKALEDIADHLNVMRQKLQEPISEDAKFCSFRESLLAQHVHFDEHDIVR